MVLNYFRGSCRVKLAVIPSMNENVLFGDENNLEDDLTHLLIIKAG